MNAIPYYSPEIKAPKIPWWKTTHPKLFGLLALIVAYGPAYLLGFGESPCFLFSGAIFIALIAYQFARRSPKPLLVEATTLVLLIVISAAASYLTAYPSANRLFMFAFGIAPPSGVQNIAGRAQWFDGRTIVIRFKADDSAIQQLLQSRKFNVDPSQINTSGIGFDLMRVQRHFSMSQVADRSWRQTITGNNGQLWEWLQDGGEAPRESTTVFVNENGEVWVMYNSF